MGGGISLGLDSLLACFAIGIFRSTRLQSLCMAGAFGLCDAGATMLGQVIPNHLEIPELAPYLASVVLLGLAARYSRVLLYGLPGLLAFDNIAGSPHTAHGVLRAASMLGGSSAIMALCGFALAGLVASIVSRRLPVGQAGPVFARS